MTRDKYNGITQEIKMPSIYEELIRALCYELNCMENYSHKEKIQKLIARAEGAK